MKKVDNIRVEDAFEWSCEIEEISATEQWHFLL